MKTKTSKQIWTFKSSLDFFIKDNIDLDRKSNLHVDLNQNRFFIFSTRGLDFVKNFNKVAGFLIDNKINFGKETNESVSMTTIFIPINQKLNYLIPDENHLVEISFRFDYSD